MRRVGTERSGAESSSRYNVNDVASKGYCFQVDVVRRALGVGLHLVEVPITFVEREYGTSKMNHSIVREALWRVTKWGFQQRVGWGRKSQSRNQPHPAS